jgi:ABC-type nitrate/sulfonate/bicarbonate transport system permease component
VISSPATRLSGGIPDAVISAAVLATALVIWQMSVPASLLADVPTPHGTVAALLRMLLEGTLVSALLVSWVTVLKGFGIAALLGIGTGITAGYFRWLSEWVEPILNLLRPIAPFAWIPMAILWFGANGGAGVMITSYAAFFPIVTNTLAGTARVRSSLVTAARSLGASEWTIVRRIVIMGALPLALVGLRLGFGLSWAAVIAAELATGQSTDAPPGIGYLMYLNFAVEANVNEIVALMVAIGLSALAADIAMRWVAGRLVYWPAEG